MKLPITSYRYKFVNLVTFISFVFLLVFSFTASSVETPFNYDPDKIEPGTMYVYDHFTSPNQDEPEGKKYYYIKSVNKEKIEIRGLSVQANNNVDYTEYTLNMDYMMIQSFYFQSLQEKSSLPINSTWKLSLKTDFQKRVANADFWNKHEDGIKVAKEKYKIDNIPTFFYFFRHVAMWTAMRFYPYPKDSIDVWNYTGSNLNGVKIKHLGEKTIDVPAGRIRCEKFEFSGKGLLAWLFGKKAWLWMSAEDGRGYMVRYKNNNSTGNWPMLEYKLSAVKKISNQEWRRKVNKADLREGKNVY